MTEDLKKVLTDAMAKRNRELAEQRKNDPEQAAREAQRQQEEQLRATRANFLGEALGIVDAEAPRRPTTPQEVLIQAEREKREALQEEVRIRQEQLKELEKENKDG